MTGFGKASATTPDKKITVEAKSLNSKQLDLSVRIPQYFKECEMELRHRVSRAIERGKVDVTVTVEMQPDADASLGATLDVKQIQAYAKQIAAACAELGIAPPADMMGCILRLPDAVRTESAVLAGEGDVAALNEAVDNALAALIRHRRSEGVELEEYFRKRISAIAGLLSDIEPCEAERVPKIRQRLEENIAKIPAIEIDKGRLEQEMIYYIEKLDVNEEKQRLHKHLDYFIETMEAATPGQGKKLGFIAQEMGREINTLGSKSNHAGMQAIVVKMKDALEQIKEQVLNVM